MLKRTSLFIAASLVLLVLFNLAVNSIVTGLQWDLTENKLYTLSEGSKTILENLEKDIELNLYLSEETTKNLPALRAYAHRVQELLLEFEALSDGRLTVNFIDPKPFSEAEDEASLAGLQAIPVGVANDSLYFGLVGRLNEQNNEKQDNPFAEHPMAAKEEIIAFFQQNKEKYLEYRLSQLIFNLNRDKPPLVGILSGLEVNGGVDMYQQTQRPAWVFMQFVEDLFDVEFIDSDVKTIAENVDVLLLIHPRDLAEQTLYAIDQFALGGGRVVAFIDPVAEQDQPVSMMAGNHSRSSDLGPLMAAWGIKLREAAVLGDYQNSLVVGVGPRREPVRHLGLLGLSKKSMVAEDVILAELESINVSSAGILEPVEGRTTVITPLLESSNESAVLDAGLFAMLENPKDLMAGFAPDGKQYMIAARVEGKAVTAYPEGIEIKEEISAAEPEDPQEAQDTATTEGEGSTTQAKQSQETVTRKLLPAITGTDNLNVVVVADSDILSDRLWVQVQEFFGQRIVSPWANNGDFLVNILDNLSGNASLINIRSRGRFSRPFEVVEELRREAEENFADQQDGLQAALQQTEAKLSELQQLRQGDDKALLSSEQEQALLSFRQEKLRIRKALREVQRGLDQNIEDLGAQLKLINIALVPFVLTLLVLMSAFIRRKSRAT